MELREEYRDAVLRKHDAKAAAADARADLAAHRAAVRRKAELKAELEAARAANAARRAAADEAERLRRHRELMDFYDTMTPEELQQYMQMQGRIRNEERNKDSPLRQPLAPGLPRVYDFRGDPSSWQLPSPPPSPPPEPATPPPPPQPPPEPATPPTGPPRCPVCGTLRLPGEATCLDRAPWTGACARGRLTTRPVTRTRTSRGSNLS